MKELKKFLQFLNEDIEIQGQNVEDVQIDSDIQDDEYDIEPEEETDILELTYNKELEEWEIQSELDLPDDFEDFYEWFENIDDDNPLISMKEDDDEVVFFIPEDIYINYLEDNKTQNGLDSDSGDDVEWNDDDFNEED